MNSRLGVFLILLSLGVLFQNSFAQEAIIAEPGLFRVAERPSSASIPFPENSGFITINPSVFNQANNHAPEIFTIENFPLGSEIVTLNVEQFDVLRADSKLVLGTKNGDVPTDAPAHVLLHGSIEGKENSHVYIAVFDGYAMGYVDISSGERYLIQPVSLMPEGASTMVVYKQNDVVRSAPSAEKWKCGSEEFAPNFPIMPKAFDEISKASHIPEIQAQKTVRFVSIAIDCDYGFYQSNGSDKTKAQNYAIAVLGAHCDIYVRDLSCGVMAGYLRVWTTKDTYSDDGDLTENMLPLFADYWNTNMSSVQYSAALLYSNHGGGGLAYLASLCNPDHFNNQYAVCGLNTGYVFPRDGYIWDVDVSSHEFGHICGSLHTHNCSWAPPIDSCYESEGGCFGATVKRKGTIMSYCHLTSAGTDLKFHPRVAAFLKNRLNNTSIVSCAVSVELPVASAGPDKSLCIGSAISIGSHIQSGTAPFTYSWRPATGLGSTTSEVVSAFPVKTTTYITTVTDRNMLHSYDTVIVTIIKPTVPLITKTIDSLFSSTATDYQWYLESVVIPGATNKKYVPLKSGNYTVRTTSANGCDTISKPFAFTVITKGVKEEGAKALVRIYPNPATNLLTFDYKVSNDLPLDLSIIDILGKTVFHSPKNREDIASPLVIDISAFPPGTYFVRYSFGEGYSTLKFVKE